MQSFLLSLTRSRTHMPRRSLPSLCLHFKSVSSPSLGHDPQDPIINPFLLPPFKVMFFRQERLISGGLVTVIIGSLFQLMGVCISWRAEPVPQSPWQIPMWCRLSPYFVQRRAWRNRYQWRESSCIPRYTTHDQNWSLFSPGSSSTSVSLGKLN